MSKEMPWLYDFEPHDTRLINPYDGNGLARYNSLVEEVMPLHASASAVTAEVYMAVPEVNQVDYTKEDRPLVGRREYRFLYQSAADSQEKRLSHTVHLVRHYYEVGTPDDDQLIVSRMGQAANLELLTVPGPTYNVHLLGYVTRLRINLGHMADINTDVRIRRNTP